MKMMMLTKEGCPKCVQLKMFLKMGMADKYKDEIEVIHKDEQPERYQELVERFALQTAPVLIHGEDVLLDTTPMKTEEFLRTRLG
ncbi:glutaredoxin [Exiguobacterium sp. s140]|uniref:glutaredoxin family protein n=1 Tax=Exiguobacterium sp. s140 TaxID=2751290 RepID=UPI001BEB8CF5|nr:glutaredoxin [Exiguobacterium sp. s140]